MVGWLVGWLVGRGSVFPGNNTPLDKMGLSDSIPDPSARASRPALGLHTYSHRPGHCGPTKTGGPSRWFPGGDPAGRERSGRQKLATEVLLPGCPWLRRCSQTRQGVRNGALTPPAPQRGRRHRAAPLLCRWRVLNASSQAPDLPHNIQGRSRVQSGSTPRPTALSTPVPLQTKKPKDEVRGKWERRGKKVETKRGKKKKGKRKT